jgi:hypothetical protein
MSALRRHPWPSAAAAFLLLAASGAPAAAPAGKRPPTSAAALPRVEVSLDSLLDRRTTSDFPGPALSVAFALRGEDAEAVFSARPRITRATDDTGRDLAAGEGRMVYGRGGWQEARGQGPVTPRVELASPSRKAKRLPAVEGVLETYLPSRDPAATVRIDRVLSRVDQPLSLPALTRQRVSLRVLSKASLEREKKATEARRAREKTRTKPDGEGLEAAAGAMADALVETIQRLFSNVGEHDLILKVDDPGQKIFAFDLATPDGKPIDSYGTTDVEGYRIVRMLERIPPNASLRVRLKTPRSFAEIPFALRDVPLP